MPKISNKYSQKRNTGASAPIFTFMCLWANSWRNPCDYKSQIWRYCIVQQYSLFRKMWFSVFWSRHGYIIALDIRKLKQLLYELLYEFEFHRLSQTFTSYGRLLKYLVFLFSCQHLHSQPCRSVQTCTG
jgi:hypothetical protein